MRFGIVGRDTEVHRARLQEDPRKKGKTLEADQRMADPGCKTQRRAEPASRDPFSVWLLSLTGAQWTASARVRIPSVLRISHGTTSARAGVRRAILGQITPCDLVFPSMVRKDESFAKNRTQR